MREKIKLESSAGTGHFYTTTKNKRTKPDKIEIKKFDPVARKHVIYKETKIKYAGIARKSPSPPLPNAFSTAEFGRNGVWLGHSGDRFQ